MNIGLSLRVAIAKRGINPSQFADDYGWSRQRVHKVLKSKSVSTDLLERLANYFGMTIADFIKLGE